MTAAVKVPHKHAEAIRAWADGHTIQWRNYAKGEDEWRDHHNYLPALAWLETCEYRVKPEKVYPVTQMTDDNPSSAWSDCPAGYKGLRQFANAALRHAFDANQIISMADHQDALIALGQNPRDVEISRHADRDMAIAKAVRDYIADGWPRSSSRYFPTYCESVDLAAIITKATP